MTADCVFCKIANHQMNTDMVFENDRLIVIRDILPKAPVHLLVIPKQHIPSVNELTEVESSLISEMILVAKEQAELSGVKESGYKLVFNIGVDGGQVIPHLHLHILGGKKLEE